MARTFHIVLLCIFVMLTLPATSKAATMDYVGTWNSRSTYATGKVVKYNGTIFYSLKSTSSDPNRNKVPDLNPTWWEKVGTTFSTRSVYDSTGKLIGPLLGDIYGNSATVGISIGNFLVPVQFNDAGFVPNCFEAATCVPSVANNFASAKVFESTNCSGTAYYWNGVTDINFARVFGVAYGNRYNQPTALSVDIYTPSNLMMKTISSIDNGGCKRMNDGAYMPTQSINLLVSDGTFLKTTISGYTPQFYVK